MTDPPAPLRDAAPATEGRTPLRSLLPGVVAGLLGALAVALYRVPVAAAIAAAIVVALAGALAARPSPDGDSAAGRRRREGVSGTAAVPLLDALPLPALLIDRDGTILIANPAARATFPRAIPGDAFAPVFRAPRLSAAIERAAAGHATTLDYRERGADGPARTFDVTAAPVRIGAADGAAVLVVFQDTSEQRTASRTRSDFVAFASHELRTPIAAIRAAVDTLHGAARSDPEAGRRFLNLIDEQAARMQRLVDDLLSLSRIEARVHRMPEDRVDLAAIARRAIDAIGGIAEAEGVAIDMPPSGPLPVRGDADELYQVFQNLLENAVRYGGSGGRVEATCATEEGGNAVVTVRDNGPGIASEHLPRLTERFYRVDVAKSRAGRGTGLGLAIVKHILARHGGRLRIESRLGEGAAFSVVLPLLPAPPP